MAENEAGLAQGFNEAGFPDREKAIRSAGNLAWDKRVDAFAELKIRYSGDEKAQGLIDDLKYERLLVRLSIFLEEIISPRTELFSSAEREALAPAAREVKANMALPKREMIPDLARIRAQYAGKRAQELVARAGASLPIGAIRAEAADPKSEFFTPQQIAEYRTDAILAVRGLKNEEKIAAYAEFKSLYKGDVASLALIDKLKYEHVPPDLLCGEILQPATGLFSPAERGQLAPVATGLQKNSDLPPEQRLDDLARLQVQCTEEEARCLIHRAAGLLPMGVLAAEAREPKTSLFSSAEISSYRNKFKM